MKDDDKASVTKVSKGLKAIGKDLNIPMLVCSQLRRRYGQEAHRPDSSRLRGSGQIEQDADAIMLMHKGDPQTHPDRIEVFIDKHRNGPLGQTMLRFDAATTRFEETEVW
ncbi:MAG: DnaB-like helicase C-terminal domain-containing protein [Candidatus Thorarchaeota archaeon]|jgi:replicative DNA helicase